jgi:hypothetical protein
MQTQDPAGPRPRPRAIWYAAGGLLLACCCLLVIVGVISAPAVQKYLASRGPVAGGLGDATLKVDVWHAIVGYYAGRQCTAVTSLNIQVTQPADANGVWREAWTVDACGQTEILNVEFTPSPQGGTDYAITQ